MSINAVDSQNAGSDGSASAHFDVATSGLVHAIIENNFDACVVTNECGCIIAVNNAFMKLFGYDNRQEILGQSISMLMPDHHSGDEHCGLVRYVRTGAQRPVDRSIKNLVACRKNGTLFPIRLKLNEWRSEGVCVFFATIHACEAEMRMQRCRSLLEQTLSPEVVALLLADNGTECAATTDGNHFMACSHTCTVGCINLLKFTRNAANMSSYQLAALVSHIYSEFDGVCLRYGMEPLRVIGGCYMFTSKRSNYANNHAVNAIFTAIACTQIMKQRRTEARETDAKFDVKIGLASGSVSFGLMRSRKLTFEAWGLTVNLASHLSTLAPTNGVLVSKQTFVEARAERNLHFEGPVRGISKSDAMATAENAVQAYSVWNSDEVPSSEQYMTRCCAIMDDTPAGENYRMRELYEYLLQQRIQPRAVAYDENFDVETVSFIIICVRPPLLSGTEACRRLTAKKNCPPCVLLVPSEYYSTNLCNHYKSTGVGHDAVFAMPFAAKALQPWLEQQKEPMRARNKRPLSRRPSADDSKMEAATKPKVLIVDDVAANVLLARKLLEPYANAIEIVSAADGRQAVTIVKNTAVALCFVDVRMPYLDGIDFTEILRRSYTDAELPVIGLTSADDIDNLTRCYDVGMNDVLYKPLDSVRLCAIINRWLPEVAAPTIVGQATQ
jgi:PAS domain S-box-containing protein